MTLRQVKLLSAQLYKFEWLLWLPVDSLFADAPNSLDALTDEGRANLILMQDGAVRYLALPGVILPDVLLRCLA